MKQLSNYFLFITFSFIISLTSCTKNEVTKVTLSDTDKLMLLGQKDSLFANMEYTGDIVPSVKWTSSNTAVAKVIQGEIEAITKGTAVITAQAGNKTATCNITVNNEIKPVLSKGELWFWGDIYQTGFSNNFTVCIASTGIKFEDLTGEGEFMFLELNTDTTITNTVPAGTYEVDDTFLAGTMVAGWVDDDEFPWGTWYFGNTYNDVVSGIVVVTVNNNVYTFQYNLVDYYGNNIIGTFTGPLTYFDYTESDEPQSIKKILTNKKRSLVKSKVFRRIR